MALSAQVPANNVGIENYICTNHSLFKYPKYCTKKKLMLHSTATPGAKATAFYKKQNSGSANTGVEFFLDWERICMYLPVGTGGGKGTIKTWHAGSGTKGSANNTHVAAEMCEPIQTQMIPINFCTQSYGGTYNRSYSIQRIQMELKYLGYFKGNIDGVFGANTKAAVLAWEKAERLTQTGAIDRTRLKKLAARKGSYAAYDVEGATPQFNAVYNNAVKLFGWLCKYLGAKPSEIICHSEGHTQGIASNHGDVMHWFPYHGKDMNAFRKDVQDWIDNKFVYLGTIPPATKSAYAKNVDKLVDAGIITTPEYWYDVEKAGEVNNQFVMALLRNAGMVYCRLLDNEVAAIPAIKSVYPEFSYDEYLRDANYDDIGVARVRAAIYDVYNIANGENPDSPKAITKNAEEVIVDLVSKGIIGSPELWLKGLKGEVKISEKAHLRYLISALGTYVCKQNYVAAVDAVKHNSGMNSEAYWKSGKYSAGNTVCLVNALSKIFAD